MFTSLYVFYFSSKTLDGIRKSKIDKTIYCFALRIRGRVGKFHLLGDKFSVFLDFEIFTIIFERFNVFFKYFASVLKVLNPPQHVRVFTTTHDSIHHKT